MCESSERGKHVYASSTLYCFNSNIMFVYVCVCVYDVYDYAYRRVRKQTRWVGVRGKIWARGYYIVVSLYFQILLGDTLPGCILMCQPTGPD